MLLTSSLYTSSLYTSSLYTLHLLPLHLSPLHLFPRNFYPRYFQYEPRQYSELGQIYYSFPERLVRFATIESSSGSDAALEIAAPARKLGAELICHVWVGDVRYAVLGQFGRGLCTAKLDLYHT